MGATRVLFCTAAGKGYGMGHLRRCLAIVEEGDDLLCPTLCILRGDRRACEKVLLPEGLQLVERPEDADDIDLVVSDLRDTSKGEMARLVRIAPVAAVDDTGTGRQLAAVCIHTLPLLRNLAVNCSGPSYMVLSPRIKEVSPISQSEKNGVLVSFGGSDAEGLTTTVAKRLNRMGIRPMVIRGPFFSCDMKDIDAEVVEGGIDILDSINIAEVLISSFGITMYEAFYLGTPVLLINRSKYHEELARKTPAIVLGYEGGMDFDDMTAALKQKLDDREGLLKSARQNRSFVDGNGASRIVSVILQTAGGRRKDCLFSHGRYRAVKRCEGYSLLRCRRCGDLFLHEIRDKGGIYDNEQYFLEDYEQQYGRSYIEDRENIVAQGIERLKIIEEIAGFRGRILDVGCALGFFLDLARSRGWEAEGIEISGFASKWAEENLSLDIITGSFLDLELSPDSYDAVSLLFVAEHLYDMEAVARKTYAILKKGGILFLAMPNRGGISFRINRKGYIDHHPRDHYIDTNLKNLTNFLSAYGFKRKRVRITGIHPERFFESVGLEKRGPGLNRLYIKLAKILSLGDTFEFYAVKV